MTWRVVIAIAGAVALAALDLFLLTVTFIGTPAGFWFTIAVTAGLFVAAAMVRMPWLAFVAQNVVSVVLLYRLRQYALLPAETRGSGYLTGLLTPIVAIMLGNLLVWPVARWLVARNASTD